jgi:cell division transport system permease protein
MPSNGDRKAPDYSVGLGASQRSHSLTGLLNNYLLRHVQTLIYTLGQLWERPMATLMTTAVIGIALSMPAGLHLLLSNGVEVLQGWNSATQISLFLHKETSEKSAQALREQLTKRPQVESVEYISREQALQEFRAHSGLGDALNALDDNPLPAVMIVFPASRYQSEESLAKMVSELGGLPEVDMAQLDMKWIQRLFALVAIGERGVLILSSLFALAVLLVVGNTIRLAIQNRRDEIIIIKLIGATDAFIRRPFLYTGIWYGLLGAIIALVLVEISLLMIMGPVSEVALLYHSDFTLHGVDGTTFGMILLTGPLLGFVGSWVALGRHLREVEPS